MTWVKIDDGFADHPKVVAAGALASWLFVCGLTYCSRQLTDGFIPSGQVRKLADVDDAVALAQTLVDVGLWDAVDGGYQVHDYLAYNPSRERTLATREARSESGRRGGKQKASNLLDDCQDFATGFAKQNSTPYPSPTPVYTPPTPSEGESVSVDSGETNESSPEKKTRSGKIREKDNPYWHDLRRWYLFDEYWQSHPRKVAKEDAMRAWRQVLGERDNDEATMQAFHMLFERSSIEWKRRPADKVPHFATWINRRDWEDSTSPLRAISA